MKINATVIHQQNFTMELDIDQPTENQQNEILAFANYLMETSPPQARIASCSLPHLETN